MRRQLVSLAFALLALVPPVTTAAPAVGEPLAERQGPAPSQAVSVIFREEAAMVLAGAALIGISTALRRTTWMLEN